MTRKDYILLAEALKSSNATDATLNAVALALATDNPRFDYNRFFSACGRGI